MKTTTLAAHVAAALLLLACHRSPTQTEAAPKPTAEAPPPTPATTTPTTAPAAPAPAAAAAAADDPASSTDAPSPRTQPAKGARGASGKNAALHLAANLAKARGPAPEPDQARPSVPAASPAPAKPAAAGGKTMADENPYGGPAAAPPAKKTMADDNPYALR